jgi:formylglycine-generating enzyme required for sulfatase activity
MGEGLGLTGAEAEDLIDEYLDEVAAMPMAPLGSPTAPRRVGGALPVTTGKPAAAASPRPASAPKPGGAAAPAPKPAAPKPPPLNVSPAARAMERQKFPNFHNTLRCEMYLVPSGTCQLGSSGPEAQENEQPITSATIGCFYMSRYPITNAQYEKFDASHSAKRATGADDKHPVVYVSALDAERFCEWLSRKESRKYRLPTEAEWEYAARGLEARIYPWGDQLNAGHYANFADARTTFAWREPAIDDGFAQSAPVGSYPRGASPFGIEDLAGNVFEWCCDGFELYRGKDVINPRGPRTGPRRIYRGGSWKSRAASLRASARAFNAPNYSSNDVGFRIVCEPE